MIELLTIPTVALELQVSTRTVIGYLDKGYLKRVRIGGLVRIDREDFENFKKGQKNYRRASGLVPSVLADNNDAWKSGQLPGISREPTRPEVL